MTARHVIASAKRNPDGGFTGYCHECRWEHPGAFTTSIGAVHAVHGSHTPVDCERHTVENSTDGATYQESMF